MTYCPGCTHNPEIATGVFKFCVNCLHRHLWETGMNLSFTDIRAKNVLRLERDWKHSLTSWSIAEWANAAAGEMGEACNVVKKILCWDSNVRTELAAKSRAEYVKDLADELADVFLYVDLLAARAGIDLEIAIIKKFNRKSEEIGSDIRL